MVSNKKGQQMTLGTIIAIVLGIAVLVFLIFGFSTGWNNMWEKITQYGGGDANVDDVVRGCEIACSGNSVNSFCVQKRTVIYSDGKSNTGSCKTFLDKKADVGIKVCSIDCSSVSVPPLEGDGVSDADVAQKKIDDAQKRVDVAAQRVTAANRVIGEAVGTATAEQRAALDSADRELEEANEELRNARAAL